MVYPLSRTFIFPLFRSFIRSIDGLWRVPKKGPYIIAGKHITALDGYILASVLIPYLNQKVHFVANARKWGPIWDRVVARRWAATIPFDTAHRSQCLVQAQELLRQDEVVVIFPEGYLCEYGQRQYQARTGVARLALWEHLPIVPVGFRYTISVQNRQPVLYQYHKSIANLLRHPRSLDVVFGQPFELASYYGQPITRDLLRTATEDVMRHIDSLCQINNINIRS